MARARSSNPQSEKEAPERAHELKDFRLLVIIVFLVLIVTAAFVIHGSLWGWFLGLGGSAAPAQNGPWQVIGQGVSPPAQSFPALQLNPQHDLRAYQQEHERRLRSYGWINPAAGVIQLPIERAMQLVAERGLPQWRPAAARFEFTGAGTNATADIDAAFLKEMARSSAGAIELGGLGVDNAQSSQLSDACHKLAQEHQKLLGHIQDAASKTKAVLPQAPGLQDQLTAQRLRQKQGNDFDQTLARQLLADNAKALAELHEATNQLQRSEVKGLASHLEEKLESEMQDLRDAAKAVGLSQGTILSVVQRQQSAVGAAETPGGEQQGWEYQSEQSSQPSDQSTEKEESSPGNTNGQALRATNKVAEPGSSAHSQAAASSPSKSGLDAAFLTRLAQAGVAEQQLGQLGLQRARSQSLTDLSRSLVQDHARLSPRLQGAARELEVALPSDPGLEDQLVWKQLQQRNGIEFEQALACHILADQAKLLQETENTTNQLQSSEVKHLAEDVAANLRQHLPHAKQAAQATGIKPETIERIIVMQMMAAGAPVPLMAGAENESNSRQQPAVTEPQKPGQGAASSAGGEQSGTGSSPLQLQQQRAHQPEGQAPATGK